MTMIDQFPPMLNQRVAALVYDGLCMFEFACIAEVFGLKRPEAGPGWYTFETASLDGKPVATQFGGRLAPDGCLRQLRDAGTIIIPGWQGMQAEVPTPLVAALRTAHSRGARLLSICSGSVVLAATGLLNGQRATTHWRYAQAMRERFPAVEVDPDVLYIDNGQLLTSAGSAAGLDLALHLIRRDHGTRLANLVARRLVVSPQREGGQAQFVQQPVPPLRRDRLVPLLEKIQRTLERQHSVAGLAAKAGMSERSFLRHFRAATGTTPNNWLTNLRMQRARELLETTDLPVDAIAERSGFGTAMTLRHHFRERLTTSPMAYRRNFGAKRVTR